MTVMLVHRLLAAPPPHSACSYLVRCIQAQTVYNGRDQTTTEAGKHPSIAHIREKKRLMKKSKVKRKNWIEPERKQE